MSLGALADRAPPIWDGLSSTPEPRSFLWVACGSFICAATGFGFSRITWHAPRRLSLLRNPGLVTALALEHVKDAPCWRVEHAGREGGLLAAFQARRRGRLLADLFFHGGTECRDGAIDKLIFIEARALLRGVKPAVLPTRC
jgi:hypothetical protein